MHRQKFQEFISWRVGRGNTILFCRDSWVGGRILEDQFPQILPIAQFKNITVEEANNDVGVNKEMDVNVIRNLNDWEINEYETLLHLLSLVNLSSNNDQTVCKLNKKGQFISKSYYNHLVRNLAIGETRFSFKQIWKGNTPLKLTFFAWEVEESVFDY